MGAGHNPGRRRQLDRDQHSERAECVRAPLSNADAFRSFAGHGFVPPLEGVHRANIALATFNLFAYAAFAAKVLRNWRPAVIAALALLATPLFWVAAVAETPSQLLLTYMLVGSVCYEAIFSSKTPKSWHGWVGATGLSVLVVLCIYTRQELAIVAVPPAVIGLWRVVLGPDDFARRAGRLGARATHKLSMWRNDPMALGCATLLIIGPNLILIAIGDLAQPHEVRAIFRAVNPLDASTLAIVPALWETLSPGLIVLTILGIAVGHTHPIRTGMLALSGLALFRAHYAAGHDGSAPFEMVRYQTFLLPALALVAVHGWRYVQQLQLSRPLRVTVAVVVVAALFSNPGRLESQRLDRNRTFATIADPNTDAGWLSMEMQRQVRFLAAAIAKRPQCSIIIPTAIPHDQPGTDIKRLVPGGLIVINGASAVQYEETTVAALRTSVPALQSGCVHYHVSLDCHQVDFTGCEKSWMKGPVVDRSSFPYEGFSEPREHGIYDGRIELRLHDISSQ